MANEESGDHYTPRDAIRTLVAILFSLDRDNLQNSGLIRSTYDPCVGTGGMLQSVLDKRQYQSKY